MKTLERIKYDKIVKTAARFGFGVTHLFVLEIMSVKLSQAFEILLFHAQNFVTSATTHV